jgi:hypothetical protein
MMDVKEIRDEALKVLEPLRYSVHGYGKESVMFTPNEADWRPFIRAYFDRGRIKLDITITMRMLYTIGATGIPLDHDRLSKIIEQVRIFHQSCGTKAEFV